MRLRSIVSYFVALNHGIIRSLFGVFGKPVNEVIVIGGGNSAAGVDDCRQSAGVVVKVGNGVRGGDGIAVPFGMLGVFVKGQESRPLVPAVLSYRIVPCAMLYVHFCSCICIIVFF